MMMRCARRSGAEPVLLDAMQRRMMAKLGFADWRAGDEQLVDVNFAPDARKPRISRSPSGNSPTRLA